MTQPAPCTRLDRISDTERGRQSHAIRSPSGPAASKQRPLSYRNRWSSVPAQQSPSLERAYRPRSRHAKKMIESMRGARGFVAAQNRATLPNLCKCTACKIWWLGMPRVGCGRCPITKSGIERLKPSPGTGRQCGTGYRLVPYGTYGMWIRMP